MARRTYAQFIGRYGSSGSIFPDNTTEQISEGDVRQFGQDIADSFLLQLSSVEADVDTSGATITLNFNDFDELLFSGDTPIGSDADVAFDNEDNAVRFTFMFEISAGGTLLNFPANWTMSDANFQVDDPAAWTSPGIGIYKMKGNKFQSSWLIDIIGPYTIT